MAVLVSLRRLYSNNFPKLSVIEMLEDVKSERFRQLFLYIMEMIVNTEDQSPIDLLCTYLNHMSLLNVVNTHPIVVPTELFKKVMTMTPTPRKAEMYSYMVNINFIPEDLSILRQLQYQLSKGSEIEKYIVRTGQLNAKWHDTVKPITNETLKQKMLYFFSFDNIRMFTFQAIKRKDLADSNMYLDILVSKFEQNCTEIENSVFVLDNAEEMISSRVQNIMRTVLFYLMTFKGADASIKIIHYMLKNNIEIKFEILSTIMSNLMEQGFYDEAIVVINSIKLDALNGREKKVLVDNIFKLMAGKFSDSPKVLLGYATTLFRSPDQDISITDLLNGFRILSVAFGSTKLEYVKSPNIVSASVDQNLTGVRFSHESLYHIYTTSLQNTPREEITPEFIFRLFMIYLGKIKTSKHVFLNERKISDSIVTLFLNYSMKVDPTSNKMKLIRDKNNYDTARAVLLGFFKSFKLNPSLIKPYPFELMIYSSLILHNDLSSASEFIRVSRSYKLPFTFNQLYPFIIYHYQNGQFKQAESWYKMLVSHGIKSKSSEMNRIFEIARELKWDIKGFSYRRQVNLKNRASREAMKDINDDNFSSLGARLNEDLAAFENQEKMFPNFKENLTALLQTSQLK
ncbi:hypothetical protein PSN45_003290 [Yamadazyma tenuis]|nr:hypothetical protein PSN45_003290 [Yamadazyma tenuis]